MAPTTPTVPVSERPGGDVAEIRRQVRVRQQPERVARVEWLRLEHVHRPQRIEQGVLVDQVGAAGVHKPRGRTHGADFSRADDAHGRFREDEVHRDNVRPGEGFPFGHVLGLAGRRSRNREVGAPGGHAHAEGIADACHARTGAAQPEEPQRREALDDPPVAQHPRRHSA